MNVLVEVVSDVGQFIHNSFGFQMNAMPPICVMANGSKPALLLTVPVMYALMVMLHVHYSTANSTGVDYKCSAAAPSFHHAKQK